MTLLPAGHPEASLGRGDTPGDKLIRDLALATVPLSAMRAIRLLADVVPAEKIDVFARTGELILADDVKIVVRVGDSEEFHPDLVRVGMRIDTPHEVADEVGHPRVHLKYTSKWAFSCVDVPGHLPVHDNIASLYLKFASDEQAFREYWRPQCQMRLMHSPLEEARTPMRIGVEGEYHDPMGIDHDVAPAFGRRLRPDAYAHVHRMTPFEIFRMRLGIRFQESFLGNVYWTVRVFLSDPKFALLSGVAATITLINIIRIIKEWRQARTAVPRIRR